MADLNVFGLPGISTGILFPLMSNRFRFMIADLKNLTMQTTKLNLDMLNRTVDVEVQQPIGLAKDFLDDIYFLGSGHFENGKHVANEHAMSIDLMDGDGCVVDASIAGYARLIKHEFVLDYAESKVATHKLTFAYTKTA